MTDTTTNEKIISLGTLSYNNDKMKEYIAINYSNPNLLINSWFGEGVVNQRGQSTYTGAKYTVDRWYSSYCDVSVNDGYITITKDVLTRNQNFRQYLPPEVFRYLCGKTVTFSVDCDIKVAGNVVLQYCADGVYGQETRFTDTGRKIRTVTMELPDTITSSLCILISLNTPVTELTSVDLYSAKLELGSIATPFTPPNPAAELAKCQRYFYRIDAQKTAQIFHGVAYSSNNCHFPCQLPVEMRIVPTMTYTSDNWRFAIKQYNSNATYWNNEYGITLAIDTTYSSNMRLELTADIDSAKSTTISVGEAVILITNPDKDTDGNIKFPAWIDFSAEL